MKLSILIPCYNEEGNLVALSERIRQVFGSGDYECVFVNDGSRDGTLEELRQVAGRQNTPCKILNFTRNFGKEAAMYAGLSRCEGEYIGLIDADLQHEPEMLRKMLTLLERDDTLDMVAAVQTIRRENYVMKRCKKIFYCLFRSLVDLDFRPDAGDFRVFRRSVRDAVLSMPEVQRFSKGLFCWGGFRVAYLPYEASARRAGVSKWSFGRLFGYAVSGIVSFSTRPLRLPYLLGGIALAGAVVSGVTRHGLAALVLAVGGLQFLCLGILGEYLAGVFMQAKNRPLYWLRSEERYPVKKG